MTSARKLTIKGRVQGVYYRDSTKQKALELGLKGWVRNLSNGDVEALIIGDESNINKMIRWAWEGPTLAIVRDVKVEIVDQKEDILTFYVRH